jgi:hypothetical protein
MTNNAPDEVRRFPTPWRVEEREAAYRVLDATGSALGHFYSISGIDPTVAAATGLSIDRDAFPPGFVGI